VPFVYAYDHHHDCSFDELKRLVGGKAAGLNAMAVTLGLPVPPAFSITTAACNEFLSRGWPEGLDEEIRAGMARLEAIVGRRFGDASDPLLVSVRSGAPVSMPGMMETILNLGLNHDTEAALAEASGDAAFARNCHDRFHALYRDVVGVQVVPTDPWDQLRGAIEAVFRSWNGDKAKTYREHEGISETLGTGVTVQAMVFGNLGEESGTGVLFTRNPATGEHALYGDVVFRGQGEDVVAGTHDTLPVACLEERMPEVAAELHRHAERLERHYADARDIEFTIERRRLWMLQDRNAKRTEPAALRMAVEMAEDPSFPLTREAAVRRVSAILANPPKHVVLGREVGTPLTSGLGVSPGVVCGEIALTAEAAVLAADAGRDVILVRAETSPDDVHGMARACGILTATGGLVSHAAVVARDWNKPAVVGASEVAVDPDGGTVSIAGRVLTAGTLISIDGSTGEVFEGHASGVEEVVPEAKVLLGWARELGIAIGSDRVEAADAAATVRRADDGAPSLEGALRMLVVRDFRDTASVAVSLGCTADEATALLDELLARGRIVASAGAYKLTPEGKADGAALMAADAAAWGSDAANAALDAFIVLDRRVKAFATAWQLKDGAPNSHADAAYDDAVLTSLAPLHAEVMRWIEGAVAGLPRLAHYGLRLTVAADAVAAGNGKYVASPRVDSYHGAWFELHEDLILLAGRNRAEEVAAGRA
jgi:pyruvate,orthophosphate dikinase